ncbi:MAG: TetR/AcrR family transcriptional regulator [Tetrasphaera sp.]
MATLREAQKAMTRDLLLEGALTVFGRKGYAAATIDDIAKEAGATRTTFYLHFASKTDLTSQLLTRAEEILTATEGPNLTEVARTGEPALIRAWLDSRIDQWDSIKPYLLVSYEASSEPEVSGRTEQWFETVVDQMAEGLAQAGRFDEVTRRVRSLLAFGQFEYLSRRYFSTGWTLDRTAVVDQLTESWRFLLTE